MRSQARPVRLDSIHHGAPLKSSKFECSHLLRCYPVVPYSKSAPSLDIGNSIWLICSYHFFMSTRVNFVGIYFPKILWDQYEHGVSVRQCAESTFESVVCWNLPSYFLKRTALKSRNSMLLRISRCCPCLLGPVVADGYCRGGPTGEGLALMWRAPFFSK